MFSYFAYGLGIQSALPLPEFVAAKAGCDVTIRLGSVDSTPNDYVPLEVADRPAYLKITSSEAIISLKDIGVFLVRGGNEVVVIPAPSVDDRLIRSCIVGTVMAVLLYQRGLLVLHASVVYLNGGAVAFIGNSGAGKSSTAAALYARGHNIIADDVAAVKLGIGSATVFPGFPQIKLSPEAAVSLGYDIESLHLLHPQEEKRGYRLTHGFPQAPLPLLRVYVIAEDAALNIEPLRPQEAVIELVRHSRPTTLFHSGGTPHFLQCANLAKELTVYRLKRPRCLSLLPDLAQLVEEHVARVVHSAMIYSNPI